jgi:hypothetical protein
MHRTATRVCALVLCACAGVAPAVNIRLDYTYDTSGFFSTATANGQAARATVEAAASYLSAVVNDTFDAIQTPPPFASTVSNGVVTWRWEAQFNDPSGSGIVQLQNPTIPANEYRIYVGARELGGLTLGFGGPGGFSSGSTPTGTFSVAEQNQILQINQTFLSAVADRGDPPSQFARWGGALSFDTTTNWHYSHLTPVATGASDLYSVAMHELVHALGFGAASEWNALISGSSFLGSAATASFGSAPLVSPDQGHWAELTQSTVYGVGVAQETLMDPTIATGARQILTALDAAALTDIGWELGPAPGLVGDYNADGAVNAADYTVWRDTLNGTTSVAADGTQNGRVDQADYTLWVSRYGNRANATAVPEPGSLVLAVLALGVGRGRRRACGRLGLLRVGVGR